MLEEEVHKGLERFQTPGGIGRGFCLSEPGNAFLSVEELQPFGEHTYISGT